MEVRHIKYAIVAVVLGIVALFGGCSFDRVDPGNVGIRVAAFGGGIQTETVQPGRWVWNGPGYSLYEYPTFKQTATWTKQDGKQLTFQTADGGTIGADVGMTYAVGPTCVAKFFSEFRVPIDQVTDTFVLNNVRSAFNNAAATYKDAALLIPGKAALLDTVEKQVRKDLGTKCLVVDDVYLVGEFDLPGNIRQAINAKIQSTQLAVQRQNELVKAQAEAEIAKAEAVGTADATLLKARAEAEAIQIKGDALRNNPGLVEFEKVNAMKIAASRWNGAGELVPRTVIGDQAGRNMIFQLPSNQ